MWGNIYFNWGGALTLLYIGDLQMFNNRYEDAMNNSEDEEILEDG